MTRDAQARARPNKVAQGFNTTDVPMEFGPLVEEVGGAITCEELSGALRELANRTGNGNAYFPALAADIFRYASGHRASPALATSQETQAAALDQAASDEDSPLTHFFHCWRFPDHHACAVALIERQGEEIDQQLVRAATAERELADLRRAAVQDHPERIARGKRRHG